MNLFYNLLIVERIFLIINAEDVVNILDNADSPPGYYVVNYLRHVDH